ncbi:YsnF/AvaK domain-containing protein [Cesiribacter sp. SM1]|uniref:YsnF/AvaK domain-containing protein n=1 Tax=Cesiribacter sp. SM1 TaxID=2861196 RepID=UPI001CD27E92|nr:YsnF/AvaK domain-containing protein [Cesiribacter sp. SM1]
MKQTVIGIYNDRNKAIEAEQALIRSGFQKETVDISRGNTGQAESSGSSKHKGFFASLFGSDDEVQSYSAAADRGTVVTVHATSRNEAERAAVILDKFGSIEIGDSRQNSRAGAGSASGYTQEATGDMSIPVIEENMQVGKRDVETGSTRIRSRIIERPVEEHLRLREEHVTVDRHPVNRPASEADLNAFKDTTIEAHEHAEVPIVKKEARVVEEVNIQKEVSEHDETIRGSVRKQDVDVDRIDADKDRNRK